MDSIRTKQVHETTDGKIFEDKVQAVLWQERINSRKVLIDFFDSKGCPISTKPLDVIIGNLQEFKALFSDIED